MIAWRKTRLAHGGGEPAADDRRRAAGGGGALTDVRSTVSREDVLAVLRAHEAELRVRGFALSAPWPEATPAPTAT